MSGINFTCAFFSLASSYKLALAHRASFIRAVLLLSLLAALSGCVRMNDPEGTQDFQGDVVGIIDPGHAVGQSFVSLHPRLNGISIWLSTRASEEPQAGYGQLLAKLYHAIGDTAPIYVQAVDISPSWQNSQVDIQIPAQDNPASQLYFVLLESTGGTLEVHGRNENAYPDGIATINNEPISSDIAFKITYDYDGYAVLQDLSTLGSDLYLIFPLAIALIFPGWFFLEFSGQKKYFSGDERFGLSVGLSLAIVPLLMLWSSVLGIRWSRAGVLWTISILMVLLLFRWAKSIHHSKVNLRRFPTKDWLNLFSPQISSYAVLACIFLGSFFVRFAMVRDLSTPAWVDSVHHAMITRLILEEGNLPSSYAPYMDFDPNNYHTGFHSSLALFTWLSGLNLPDSMLLYGQVVNSLVSLGVYLITKTYTRKTSAGLLAAFITSFLTPMPSYYTSWGRYTQLAGLLILPIVPALIHPIFDQLSNRCKGIKNFFVLSLLAAVALGGLLLVHYRVIGFVAVLLVAEFFGSTPWHWSKIKAHLSVWAASMILYSSLAVIFTLPWIIPTVVDIIIPKLSPASTSTELRLFWDFSWRFLTTALGKQSLALAGLGLLWSLIKKPRFAAILLLWVIGLLFLSNLDALHLPGGGFITGTSVVIMLFIPISMMGGYFLAELLNHWASFADHFHRRSIKIALRGLVTAFFSFIAILGAQQLIPIINPITILSRQSDRAALDWIQENIPSDSKFLINPFSWGFGLYVGGDGGYWISPVTGALTIPPPALYGLGSPETIQGVNSISSLVSDPQYPPDELWQYMIAHDIDYIYIGARGGPLSPNKLVQSGLFEPIYTGRGTWVIKSIHTP